jgi:hypothetical protein
MGDRERRWETEAANERSGEEHDAVHRTVPPWVGATETGADLGL